MDKKIYTLFACLYLSFNALFGASYLFNGEDADGNGIIEIENLNLRDKEETRYRYGGSLGLDYELKNGSLRFNSLLSRTDRDEVLRRRRYRVEGEKRDTLPFNYSIRSYLFTSVRNHCIDQLRKNNRQISVTSLLSNDRAVRCSSPEEEFIYSELDNQVSLAIDALPPECKKIFKLSRYHGLKYREIAEKLNISIKTVEAQMGKALKRLKTCLAPLMAA